MDRKKENIRISKYLSLILRHKPYIANISLDNHGWANVEELLEGIKPKYNIDLKRLEEIVREDNKQRYSFDSTHSLIRANQGHSINIDLELKEQKPPQILWHGTGGKSAPSILKNGILPMSRQFVHLSKDIPTAIQVGKRHGKPVIFKIDSEEMFNQGYKFYLSENKIWLTNFIPPEFISLQF